MSVEFLRFRIIDGLLWELVDEIIDKMDTSTFILIMLPVFIFCLAMAVKHEKKKTLKNTNKLENIFSKVNGFHTDKKIQGFQSLYMLCFDNKKKQLFYTNGLDHRLLNYSDIIKVELIEDNSIISSKSAIRTIGGGLIGGAVAGGAGVIVGGLSGGSKQKKKVSKVKVKILLRDMSLPALTITCFDSIPMTRKTEVSPTAIEGGSTYLFGLQQAEEIVDLISVIIDKEDSPNQTEQSSTGSLSDELLKLHELKEKGILTSDEFDLQKTKLLS